jgi:ketosteroid isomerase-like protein
MKTVTALLFAGLIAVGASCNRNAPGASENDTALKLAAEMTAAFNSGDVSKLMSYYDDDAVFISCGWRMGGKDSIESGMKYLLAHSSEMTFYPVTVSASGGLLSLNGLLTFTWKNESYTALAKGSCSLIWKKQPSGKYLLTFEEENHGDIREK